MTIAAQCNHDWRYGLRDSENGSYRRCQKCRYVESTEPAVAPTPVERKTDLQRIQGSYSSGSQSAVAPAESQGACMGCRFADMKHRSDCPSRPPAESQGVERVTDDAPARVEPTRKHEICEECGDAKSVIKRVPCRCAAQPAKHTDDRPAETIPEQCEGCEEMSTELKASEDDVELCPGCMNIDDIVPSELVKLADHLVDCGMPTHADLVRRAETRIEVLEAALREILGRFPSDEVIDAIMADKGPGYRFCPMEPVPRDSDVIRWRAALAAPSGKQEKI